MNTRRDLGGHSGTLYFGTQRALGHSGTRALRTPRYLSTCTLGHAGTWAFRHSGTQGTWAINALGHLGTQDTLFSRLLTEKLTFRSFVSLHLCTREVCYFLKIQPASCHFLLTFLLVKKSLNPNNNRLHIRIQIFQDIRITNFSRHHFQMSVACMTNFCICISRKDDIG